MDKLFFYNLPYFHLQNNFDLSLDGKGKKKKLLTVFVYFY